MVIVTGFSQETTAVNAFRAVRDYVMKSPNYLDYLPEAVVRVLRQVQVGTSAFRLRIADLPPSWSNGPSVAFITDGDGKGRLCESPVHGRCSSSPWPTWKAKWPMISFLRPSQAKWWRQRLCGCRVRPRCSAANGRLIPPWGRADRFWTTFRFAFESSSGDCAIGGIAIDITWN